MSSIAFVFPGQGSQVVGMGRTLAAASPAAAAVFAEADDALGEPLSRLVWEGPADELDLTANAQPALLAASIAFLRALQERRAAESRAPLVPSFYAGHSMGQYSALVAAGVISLTDGVRLVRERGRQMQASGEGSPGAMAAVIGLPDERLADLVAAGAAVGTFGVANRNSPGQVVVSGAREASPEPAGRFTAQVFERGSAITGVGRGVTATLAATRPERAPSLPWRDVGVWVLVGSLLAIFVLDVTLPGGVLLASTNTILAIGAITCAHSMSSASSSASPRPTPRAVCSSGRSYFRHTA